MTNPSLSIETTHAIGRVYQRPNGGYPKKISSTAARRGLNDRSLAPSITNVISALNKNMEEYAVYMMEKHLRENGAAMENLADAKHAYITHRNNAAARGTRVHKAIEDFIDAGYATSENIKVVTNTYGEQLIHIENPAYKEIESYRELVYNDGEFQDLKRWQAFLKFIVTFNPEFISQEATVYGETEAGLNYAGTTDFIARINGKVYVGDWKCSSKMSATVALQLAAVINAKEVTTDFKTLQPMPKIEAARGIHLDKDGNFGVYKADFVQGWQEFQALRTVWNHYAFDGNYHPEYPLIKRLA